MSCSDINWRERILWASVAGECLVFQYFLCALKRHKKLNFQIGLQDYHPEKKKLLCYLEMSELTWRVGGLKRWRSEEELKWLQNAYFQVITLLNLISLQGLSNEERAWALPCWWLAAERGSGEGSQYSLYYIILLHVAPITSLRGNMGCLGHFISYNCWTVFLGPCQMCPSVNTIPMDSASTKVALCLLGIKVLPRAQP